MRQDDLPAGWRPWAQGGRAPQRLAEAACSTRSPITRCLVHFHGVERRVADFNREDHGCARRRQRRRRGHGARRSLDHGCRPGGRSGRPPRPARRVHGPARPEELATLWYGEYDPATGTLTHASAGHPPPVVTVDGADPVLLDVTDAPPLGTGLAHAAAREHHAVLPAGAVLVAYTDGLVERRRSDVGDGLGRLTDAVARNVGRKDTDGADGVAQAVLDTLVADPDQAEDDVCLLVVRRLSESTPDLSSQ